MFDKPKIPKSAHEDNELKELAKEQIDILKEKNYRLKYALTTSVQVVMQRYMTGELEDGNFDDIKISFANDFSSLSKKDRIKTLENLAPLLFPKVEAESPNIDVSKASEKENPFIIVNGVKINL